jgi:long-subunit fatty acid transport protein
MVLIGADLRWQRFYNHYDKFSIRAAYRKIKNVPTRSSTQKEMDLYTVAIRNINTYKKIDLFNELIYTRIDIDSAKNFYNYSLGVQYRYNDNITVTLKGLNVFDKAGTTEYFRINPQTLRYEKPLQISPIDRKVVLGIDWVF